MLHSTIRHVDCDLLIKPGESSQCCTRCMAYRSSLRAQVSRHQKQVDDSSRTNPSSHTAFSRLCSPEKATRYHQEHTMRRACQRQVTNLHKKLQTVTEERGLSVHSSLHDDLVQIMKDNAEAVCKTNPPGTFGRVFWESQMQAASVKDARQMRWDPIMIRWCIYLRHLSSSAYELL